jgi:hypothetical protein
MFTERELLIISWCVDRDTMQAHKDTDFFTKSDANALLHKIHNVLHAQRSEKSKN